MTKSEYVQHTAMLREAQLAAGQIGVGATALGKADYSRVGYYHQAFFGLSIGIERLCKLIYIASHSIENGGSFPGMKDLLEQGHKIAKLLDLCESIGSRTEGNEACWRGWKTRPNSVIHKAIERVITEFAVATRYYNLDYLTKPNDKRDDPVSAWWRLVGKPICDLHYGDARREADSKNARILGEQLGEFSTVIHTTETGDHIDDIVALATRAGATRVVQRYGRKYVLQIVRWLACIVHELAHVGSYQKRIAPLFGLEEPFRVFMVEDSQLRTKISWDPYRL